MTDSIVSETAQRIFTDLADPQAVNGARDATWKAPLWRALEDAGLSLAWVPDDLGGAGADVAEGFKVAAMSGRFASPVALAETLLAGWLLAQAKIASPPGIMTVVPARARDSIEILANGTLKGRARGVPFAREAAHFAVVAAGAGGAHIALVDAGSCRINDSRGLVGVSSAEVTFDNVAPRIIAAAPHGVEVGALMQMGAAIRAIETDGALQSVLALATQYAQDRVAFGKPIGKFQAVQHSLARLAGESAAAMAAAGSAADAIARVGGDATRFDDGIFLEVAAARVRTAEAATEGAAIAHQVFGAIGFSREHVLHRFTLRLLSWRDDFGNESQWAADLGKRVAANGPEALWPFIAAR